MFRYLFALFIDGDNYYEASLLLAIYKHYFCTDDEIDPYVPGTLLGGGRVLNRHLFETILA